MDKDFDVGVDRRSRKPLYQQVKDCITANIASGKWPPHYQLPTYRQMSEAVGVSMITIQQSVGALVKEGVLYRKRGVGVFTAPPEAPARTGSIGLLLPDVRHSFFAKLAHAIQNHAARHKYTTVMFSLCGSQEDMVRMVELLPHQKLDGVITSPAIVDGFSGEYIQTVLRKSPVVYVDGRPTDGEHDFVETDNFRGVELALNHLVDLGHERIGFAAGHILTRGVQERIGHFRDILRDRGLPFEPAQLQISVEHDSAAGEVAAHTFLALRTPPTAIVCMNDLVARGVMHVARERGVSCPGQLSIVGFDDLDFSEHLSPPLTTVRQPVTAIGETVVDILFEKLESAGRDAGTARAVLLPPELIVRASTAPPVP